MYCIVLNESRLARRLGTLRQHCIIKMSG